MKEKAKIIRRKSKKYGYKIVARGYLADYFVKDLESLADDLAVSNSLETEEKLKNFKRSYKKNGLIIRIQENLSHLPKCEFGIEREPGTNRTIPSIRIGMKVRRSILWMLLEKFSC